MPELLGGLDRNLACMTRAWRQGARSCDAEAEANARVYDVLEYLSKSVSLVRNLALLRAFVARHAGATGQSEPVQTLRRHVVARDRERWEVLAQKGDAAGSAEALHLAACSPCPSVRAAARQLTGLQGPLDVR